MRRIKTEKNLRAELIGSCVAVTKYDIGFSDRRKCLQIRAVI
jgi:hypothetical protein